MYGTTHSLQVSMNQSSYSSATLASTRPTSWSSSCSRARNGSPAALSRKRWTTGSRSYSERSVVLMRPPRR